MKDTTRIQVIRVAGSQMISQGSDGLSRGLLTEGVMRGNSMLSFVPLHLSALDTSNTVIPWLKLWMGDIMEVLFKESGSRKDMAT